MTYFWPKIVTISAGPSASTAVALILTANNTPMLTVVMAQFVHELGMEWHLMSATAVLALGPALIVTIFGQKYVIKGLKV